MNTSTSLQALAALAVGSALLASATPADARGGAAHVSRAPARVASVARAPARTFRFNPPRLQPHVVPTHTALPAANAVHRGNARSLLGGFINVGKAVGSELKTGVNDVASGNIQKLPGDILKTGGNVAGTVIKTGTSVFTLPPPKLPNPPKPAQAKAPKITDVGFSPKQTVPNAILAAQAAAQRPVFVPTTTTATGPVFVPSKTGTATTASTTPANAGFKFIQQRIAAARQSAVTANARPNFQGHPQFAGRGGSASSTSTMSPGPGASQSAPVSQPAPVAPIATQPATTPAVQPACLRQAVTQDGQVVTFDICHNQAVVGPLAQAQAQ